MKWTSCDGIDSFENQINNSTFWTRSKANFENNTLLVFSVDRDEKGYPVVVLFGYFNLFFKLTNQVLYRGKNLEFFPKIEEIGVWVNNETNKNGNFIRIYR